VPNIPSGSEWYTERELMCDHPRIEAAFRYLFFRPTAKYNEKIIEQYNIKTQSSNNNNEATNSESDTIVINEAIVCHGNVIRYFFMRALQLPPQRWLQLAVNNCSITHFRIFPTGKISCFQLGSDGHIPTCEVTYS